MTPSNNLASATKKSMMHLKAVGPEVGGYEQEHLIPQMLNRTH